MAWRGLPILLLLSVVGCACKTAPAPTTQPVVIYVDQPAAALAFVPPVSLGTTAAPVNLSRTGRGPAAVVGYDSPVAEFYWLRTDDRFRFHSGLSSSGGGGGSWSNDRFERRSVTTRFGVLFR